MQISSFPLFLPFLFIYSAVQVDSYKFLCVFHLDSKSHFNVASTLMKALIQKGHEVYMISAYPQQQPIKNYHDIPFKALMKIVNYEDPEYIIKTNSKDNVVQDAINYFETGVFLSKLVLDEPEVQRLMASNITFDAVICEGFLSEALFGLSEHFKAPLIVINTCSAVSMITDLVGSPSPPSYVPHALSKFTEHMSFTERLVNMAFVTLERILVDFYYLPRQAALYDKYFSHLERDMYTVRRNVAVVLLNSHVSVGASRPYMPNHIEVGGMHINRQRKPLPEDIEKFIKEAKHGVVYFSMGSVWKSNGLPAETLKELTTAFKSLKQRVLWKFEDPILEDKPDNVYIRDWFPQNDVLAHENVKVFITHGGQSSLIESIYHGTPVIGIPAVGDQFGLMARVEANGYGIALDLQELNAKDIVASVKRVLNDKTFTERIKEISARYRDQPILPMDLATFWVEHVARHKGAKYLHCAGLDLHFIEYHNIDVMLVLYGGILFVFFAILYFSNMLIRAGLRKFTLEQPTKKNKQKKN